MKSKGIFGEVASSYQALIAKESVLISCFVEMAKGVASRQSLGKVARGGLGGVSEGNFGVKQQSILKAVFSSNLALSRLQGRYLAGF